MTQVSDTATQAGSWIVDPERSHVEFSVKHLWITTVRGRFTRFEGTLELTEGGGRAQGGVEVGSIDTSNTRRDAHVTSAAFLDAERHPRMTFASTGIEAANGDPLRIAGTLAICGVSRPIALASSVPGAGLAAQGDRIELELLGEISRADFDLRFAFLRGFGNHMAGDKVQLRLAISAVRQG